MSIWTTPTHIDPALRVQAPNSTARDLLVWALDPESAALGVSLAEETWRNVTFLNFTGIGPVSASAQSWSSLVAARHFDTLVMISSTGFQSDDAEEVVVRCAALNIKVALILISDSTAGLPVSGASVQNFRRWADTLAIVGEAGMVEGLLHGLGG